MNDSPMESCGVRVKVWLAVYNIMLLILPITTTSTTNITITT